MGIFNRKKNVEENDVLKPGLDMPNINITETVGDKIGTDEVRKAATILKKYKDGKRNLERRIIENEQWWKGRHWSIINKKDNKKPQNIQPTSAWLFNCVMSKYADYIDAYPEPNILPREQSDEQEAKMLSSIIPVVLDQTNFKKTYSEVSWYKPKSGAGAYGIFWDSTKLNGLGDVTISKLTF